MGVSLNSFDLATNVTNSVVATVAALAEPLENCGGIQTCNGRCGDEGIGGCYCDDSCEAYGDCCPDYNEFSGFCGNGVTEGYPQEEECDGIDDEACPWLCNPHCFCSPHRCDFEWSGDRPGAIPTEQTSLTAWATYKALFAIAETEELIGVQCGSDDTGRYRCMRTVSDGFWAWMTTVVYQDGTWEQIASFDPDPPPYKAGTWNLVCSCTDDDDDGYTGKECGGDDCKDNDPTIHPGALETMDDDQDSNCNGFDNCGTVVSGCGPGSGLLTATIYLLPVLAILGIRRRTRRHCHEG